MTQWSHGITTMECKTVIRKSTSMPKQSVLDNLIWYKMIKQVEAAYSTATSSKPTGHDYTERRASHDCDARREP